MSNANAATPAAGSGTPATPSPNAAPAAFLATSRSYGSIAEMAVDPHLLARLAAAAAVEGIDAPLQWAQRRAWQLAASPGWDGAWTAARAAGTSKPGADPTVITDGNILAAVQPLATPTAS